jgi:hypothetical protein
MLMGAFHVISGADHLSALATLAVGSSWTAMWLGFRWGVGHSVGLLLVALIFMGLKQKIDIRAVSHHLNIVVGFFMIALGLLGIWSAISERYFKTDDEYLEDGINAPTEKDLLIKNKESGETLSAEEEGRRAQRLTCCCCPCGLCNIGSCTFHQLMNIIKISSLRLKVCMHL